MKNLYLVYSKRYRAIIFYAVTIFFNVTNNITFALEEDQIGHARELFYKSVENAQTIEKAISLFEDIGKTEEYKGLALTYIGALTALKGKFAFFPITKYRYVMQGLELMDQGVMKNPNNIEARFIRGMTCYYLPFLFKRKKTANGDFRMIVRLLDTEYDQYNAQIIMNVTNFLLDHAKLNAEEIQTVKNIQNLITNNES